ncbi:uncharacterized protein MEPE_03510 [Melanopsichium pennsylvanicum]|uniref:Protection of telomeres protein 1 n=2 Tax=Melanopsichium pennsylvanicum TaxID=63383 RepID=A0AAJ4XMV3_9BASI|nr:putative protein [Melanopsichium pennsylvanicum 4]SNX84801.1 uncharacterized protein MEPE_03510 [Melanopsichium pennsylvanicum]
MPRKRKGPKREHIHADPTAVPTDNHNDLHAVTNLVAAPSTTSQQLPAHTILATSACDQASSSSNKRARHLTEIEEDRLGKLVGLERWIESVGHGRGAAVCICGELTHSMSSAHTTSSGLFHLELSCFHPNDPAQRSKLAVTFKSELARNVSEPLLLLHRLGSPAVVYLSGFAAHLLPPQQNVSRVAFNNGKAVIKMSPQPPSTDPTAPTSAIWIEQLASNPIAISAIPAAHNITSERPAPTVSTSMLEHTQRHSPMPRSHSANGGAQQPRLSPPCQHSDWFSTPAPIAHAAASTTAAASTSTMALLPPPPQQLRLGTDLSAPAAPSGGPRAIKSEGQTNSATSSPRPARALSRQVSATPAPRRNAPHVKPRRMGNCVYTPMSMVRDGERASIVGVVVAAGDPRRSSSGTRDLSIKVAIADASCLSGTGYAKELAQSMTIMLFAQQNERIPHTIKPGHIFAVRNVQIQMFSNKPQGVGKSAAPWSWATYDPVSGDVGASSNFPLASQTPPECSAEEMEHFRDMANWFSELQGVDANIMTRSSRPTLLLKDVAENVFFDTVVEVLKVYTHTLAPDLYVSDYTNHALFWRGNDKYLRLDSNVPYPDDADGWGHVFQISLWDSHATIAEGLQTGDIIRIQNVRPKLNPRGLLTGGLGSSTDSGIKIRTLKPTDEARIELEKRRARFMETLFTVEEEAFADRAEREARQASEHQPPNQMEASAHPARQQQPGEQTASTAKDQQAPAMIAGQAAVSAAPSAVATAARSTEPAADRQATASTDSTAAATSMIRTQSGPPDRCSAAVEASPVSTSQPPFPTPAQRQLRAMEVTPSKPALGTSSNGNVSPNDLSLVATPDLKPQTPMGPPGLAAEVRRPLIRCNAPASIPLTALAELPTTSLCPGMFKVKARIMSTNPNKVEQWGRMECKACKRMLPLDQRFCIKCGDEEGESLSYCLRFAIMLEEVDAEFVARKQQHKNQNGNNSETSLKKTAIPLLFHGRTAEVLLPHVDPKSLFNGERSSVKTLRRFHNRLLHPHEYGLDPEQILALHSFWSKETDRTVRRFAALKELNCLHNPRDLL